MNTPTDMLKYVIDNELEFDFITAISAQTGNYSIAEITDKKFVGHDSSYKFKSQMYSLNLDITDDEILTGIINKLYISAFISRKDNNYQVHFFVHQYPESMKERFDEAITKEVIQYMILKTIIALRLDTELKIDKYIGKA